MPNLIVVFGKKLYDRGDVRKFKTVDKAIEFTKSETFKKLIKKSEGNPLIFATVFEIGDIAVSAMVEGNISLDPEKRAVFEYLTEPIVDGDKIGQMRVFFAGDGIDGDRCEYFMVKKNVARVKEASPASIKALVEKLKAVNLDFKLPYDPKEGFTLSESFKKMQLAAKSGNKGKPMHEWELKTKYGQTPERYEMRGDRGEMYQAIVKPLRDNSWEMIKTKTVKGGKAEVIAQGVYPTWEKARASLHATRNFTTPSSKPKARDGYVQLRGIESENDAIKWVAQYDNQSIDDLDEAAEENETDLSTYAYNELAGVMRRIRFKSFDSMVGYFDIEHDEWTIPNGIPNSPVGKDGKQIAGWRQKDIPIIVIIGGHRSDVTVPALVKDGYALVKIKDYAAVAPYEKQ